MDKKRKKVTIAPNAAPLVWRRIYKEDVDNLDDGQISGQVIAYSREVDEKNIQMLLQDRWQAKMTKNYEIADKNAAALKMLRIAYHDDDKTWYTLPLTNTQQKVEITTLNRKRSKRQERNRRQAQKNRKKAAGLLVDTDSNLVLDNNTTITDCDTNMEPNKMSVSKKKKFS